MIATTIIQLITGAIGSVGFGILFHIKKKYLPLAAVGGFLSWLVFLLGKEFWGNVFLVTSVIPLIPGSTLYYCMSSIVEGNTVQALEYGRDTFLFAFGIAAGMSIAWSICYFLRSIRKKQN